VVSVGHSRTALSFIACGESLKAEARHFGNNYNDYPYIKQNRMPPHIRDAAMARDISKMAFFFWPFGAFFAVQKGKS
jgi:hypothetical protein